MKLERVEGYNWSDYDKKTGIDPTLNDILSSKLIDSVIDCILNGFADRTIKNQLYELYGMNSYSASFIVNKSHYILNEREEKQTENLLMKQNSRLFKLYRDCMENGDRKNALSVLSEINKLNGLLRQKVEISNDFFTLDLGITTKEENNDNQQ